MRAIERINRPIPASLLIVITALFVAIVDNYKFWTLLGERMSFSSFAGLGYMITFVSMHVFVMCLFLFLVGQGRLLKPILILTLLIAATLGYFNQQLGVVFDSEMIRNIVETAKDRNTQEATELLSMPLINHVLIFGAIPAIFVLKVKISPIGLVHEQLLRIGHLTILALVTFSLVMMNFKYLTFFSRENRDLRVFVNPLYPALEARKFIETMVSTDTSEFTVLGEDATQSKSSGKRTVGIVMVGETARADHFSLNGYNRETNPELKKHALVNFTNATSCGTSTAYSVPCMFSFLNQSDYTPEKAGLQSNVLDVLYSAGIKVVWVDNNSSCKGVCNRIESLNLHGNEDSNSPHYGNGEYYDLILIDQVDKYLENTSTDVLLVMHMLGSHGPTYHKRFPPEFAKFTPYCQNNSPQDCSVKEVINAYDNTILYTDHVLTSLIEKLEHDYNEDTTFLFYASDHGESLGEKGVYLHGLPRFIAPSEQTHVPVLAWFSNNFLNRRNTDQNALHALSNSPISHDNISSTLLSLFEVNTHLYDDDLDLFSHPWVTVDNSEFDINVNKERMSK